MDARKARFLHPRDPLQSAIDEAAGWMGRSLAEHDRALEELCAFAAEALAFGAPEERRLTLDYQDQLTPQREREWRAIVRRARARSHAGSD